MTFLAMFELETLSVSRRAPGVVSFGLFVPGAETILSVTGSMQPFQFRTRDQLPEGIRTRARYKFFTEATEIPLVGWDISGKQKSDILTRADGEQYEVFEIARWDVAKKTCPHFEYALLEIGDDER
jgi:hypothetical protein